MASGSFEGHGVTGTAEIVREGETYRLDLIDLVLPDDRSYGVDLLSESPVSADCSGAYWAYSLGGAEPSMDLHAELSGFLQDPSYLAGVQLQPNWPHWADDYPSCLPEPGGYPIVAYARLHWTTPDLRPDLDPVDSGPRPGATGELEEGTTGLLNQYWIAPGDTYADIADRFGVTPADLDYLNPVGWWSGRPTAIEAGCTLNVSKDVRGATIRCTWQP